MKNTIIILLSIFSWTLMFSQTLNSTEFIKSKKDFIDPSTNGYTDSNNFIKNPKNNFDLEENYFDFNCDTDFFTVNYDGVIQKWSFLNDTIIGGEIIIEGAGVSLAFCGEINSPTFYSSRYPEDGIIYFDSLLDWVEIPLPIAITNSGGYQNNQYFLVLIFDPVLQYETNKMLYHFDGTDLTIIDSLSTSYFSVADIAVDTLGQAWVFEGNPLLSVTNLNVYNHLGLVTSYDITFQSGGTYGSFFLNGVLYLGKSSNNSIIPVLLDGDSAQLGTPIPFPNYNYNDLASCQRNGIIINSVSKISKNDYKIFPNPTNSLIHLPEDIKVSKIEIFDLNGQLIFEFKSKMTIDLTAIPNGIYILKINTDSGLITKKIVKN